VKFKLISAHAMKLPCGGSATPFFLHFDTRSRDRPLYLQVKR